MKATYQPTSLSKWDLHKPGELELAIRTIEDMLPTMPTKNLLKWKGIFTSALVKVDAELQTTQMHKCMVCGFEEYGFRTELPVGWREHGDLVVCFGHEDEEIAEALQKALDADAPEPATLDELMEMV